MSKWFKSFAIQILLVSIAAFIAILATSRTTANTRKPLPSLKLNGEWGYVLDRNFCRDPAIIKQYPDCDSSYQLLEIEFWDSYAKALLVFDNQATVTFLLSNIEPAITEKTIIRINSLQSCGSLFLKTAGLDDDRLALINIAGDPDCVISNGTFASNWTIDLNDSILSDLARDRIYERILKLPLVNLHKLAVKSEGKKLIHVYSVRPQKKLAIKNRNYWEMISIRLFFDSEAKIATAVVDAFYGTGIEPPNVDRFRRANGDFEADIEKFVKKLEQELLN